MNRALLTAIVGVIFASSCARPADTPAANPAPAFVPRALRDITVPRTPERVARGAYLTEGLLQCFVCHSERDWTQPGAPPVAAMKGAGAVWPGRPWLVAPNLTPDAETGIGRWTDDMLLRAIREGIGHDGRVLHPQMWSSSFRILPDEDAEAVVAYLRSLPPVRHPLPQTVIPADEAADLEVPAPITEPRTRPAETDPIQQGRWLAQAADCSGCHSSWHTPRNPGLFGGGNEIVRGPVTTWSSNLTDDPSGIPYYDQTLFREAMRTGRVKGRTLSPAMPWVAFSHLDDADLDALFAYLGALPPVKHVVDNIDAPTLCPICGGTHPLGQYNRPRELRLVNYPLSLVADAAGTYRFQDGFEIRLAVERGVFTLVFPDGEGCALVTEDRTTFFCDGDIDRLQLVRDAAGQVVHVLNHNTDRGDRIR